LGESKCQIIVGRKDFSDLEMHPESPGPALVAEEETEAQSNCPRFLHKVGPELRQEPRLFNFNSAHFLLPPLLAAWGSSCWRGEAGL